MQGDVIGSSRGGVGIIKSLVGGLMLWLNLNIERWRSLDLVCNVVIVRLKIGTNVLAAPRCGRNMTYNITE